MDWKSIFDTELQEVGRNKNKPNLIKRKSALKVAILTKNKSVIKDVSDTLDGTTLLGHTRFVCKHVEKCLGSETVCLKMGFFSRTIKKTRMREGEIPIIKYCREKLAKEILNRENKN